MKILRLVLSTVALLLFGTKIWADDRSKQEAHPEAVTCEKKYREAEVLAGSAHQPGAMREVCQNVIESCLGENSNNIDCARAKRDLSAALVQARKFREQKAGR
jgi:hypothetical protein